MTLVVGSTAAHAAAGSVLFTLGRVEVQRGDVTLTAQRGSTVEVGDVISTGPTGMGQIRLKDGSLLALKPGASMQIEEFRYQPPAPVAVAPAAGGPSVAPAIVQEGSRSVLRLLKGAFRTITGAIGKNAGDDYRVITPAATIGIRGTDYSVAYCSGDCGSTPNGLYVGVSNGEIFVTNDVGQLVLGDNQYAYVKDSTTPPDQQLAPPEVLETPIEGEEGEEDEEEGEEPTGETEQGAGEETAPPPEDGGGGEEYVETKDIESVEPEGTYELQPVRAERSLAFGTGPLQSKATFAGVSRGSDPDLQISSSGGLLAFKGAEPASSMPVSYTIGTSQNANQGFDSVTGLRWGRWSGGTANVGTGTLNLASQSLHWIYGPATETAPVIPISGTANYILIGNTDPTDSAGNVGFLGSASLFACFNCSNPVGGMGTVDSTLNIGINNQVWQASGSGSILGGSFFAGNYGVSITDSAGNPFSTGSGSFGGFFTNNAAAAGLSYSLTDGTLSTAVSGAAAFVQGSPALAGTP